MRPSALKTHGELSKTFPKQISLWMKRLETRLSRSTATGERISVGRGPVYTPYKHPINSKFAALLCGHSPRVWSLFISENSHASLFSPSWTHGRLKWVTRGPAESSSQSLGRDAKLVITSMIKTWMTAAVLATSHARSSAGWRPLPDVSWSQTERGLIWN